MEDNNQRNMQPSTPKRKSPVFLIILVILLAGITGFLAYAFYQHKKESETVQMILEEEKKELTNELKELIVEYEDLKTDNDSMNIKLEAQQDRIKQLLAINTSNVQTIKLYKKELTTLREIMKSYIIQIDSLNQKNIALTEENINVRKQLIEIEQSKRTIEEEKDEYASKVEIASVLQAKDIEVIPLNKRGKENNKIKRIEKIRTCFTLRENPIIAAGPRHIYIRIKRPDDIILTSSISNIIDIKGEQIVFTEMREVSYENKDIDVCIYWDNNGELIEGTYTIDLFADGNNIGASTVTLR
ncbi:MAG: hypothetical protein ACOCYF_02350 [Bacteroidota bacterium]